MKRKGITLIELVIAIVIIVIFGCILVGSLRGCGAQVSDNILVNPLHSSTAKIQVLTTYFASNEHGNIYRVYAKVVHDTDGRGDEAYVLPRETFEIEDSFIDGFYRTADIFGELKTYEGTDKLFEITLRGERSGISGRGSFRQIHGMTAIKE